MNNNEVAFTTIKSRNEEFQVKIGKPIGANVNLMFNFNVFAYMEFVGVIESLPYLRATHIEAYEDETSGMAIELTEDNSLSRLIEELPELIYLYVENVEPVNTIRKGQGHD